VWDRAALPPALMATTAIIPTPVPPTASTGPIGSRAECLSALALGIADIIGVAATTVAAGADTAGVTGDSMAAATAMAVGMGTVVATDTDMAEEPGAAGMGAGSMEAMPFTVVAASMAEAEDSMGAAAMAEAVVVVTGN
jgi:hypothetical protein